MNHSKLIKISIFIVLSFAVVACGGGGGKYAKVKKVFNEQIQIMDEFVTGLEKADDAKAVAKVLNKYADGLEKLVPAQNELFKDFPELKDQKEPPAELKEEGEKMQKITERMSSAFMKLFQYSDDPDVKKAQERLEKIESKLSID